MGKVLPRGGHDSAGLAPELATLAFVEGVSASMRPVEAVIRELAQSDVPVLVLAERGAGKHATAERIHGMSRRREQPFRWFRCATLKLADLRDQRTGDLLANAGTIYLDELADLRADCQAQLLEVLPLMPGSDAEEVGRARLIFGSVFAAAAAAATQRGHSVFDRAFSA
jgi:transcriptional regulator with GAF, ATPase, and Fis domain